MARAYHTRRGTKTALLWASSFLFVVVVAVAVEIYTTSPQVGNIFLQVLLPLPACQNNLFSRRRRRRRRKTPPLPSNINSASFILLPKNNRPSSSSSPSVVIRALKQKFIFDDHVTYLAA
jgi:hypothetical protein